MIFFNTRAAFYLWSRYEFTFRKGSMCFSKMNVLITFYSCTFTTDINEDRIPKLMDIFGEANIHKA